MAKPGNSYRGFRQVSGSKIGARSIKVRVCTGCGCQHQPGTKPTVCMSCGGLAFTTFDSIGEAGRWSTLVLKEKIGHITNLDRQIRFTLWAAREVGGRQVQSKVGLYIADFTYQEDGENIIEDYKGSVIDPLAAWKLRHMEAMGKPVKLTNG